MNYINYVIKDYTEEDFSSKWKLKRAIDEDQFDWRAETIAEEIADYHFHEDPCDPDAFDCTVGLKHGNSVKWFRITAQQEVSFYCDEVVAP